MSEPRNRREYDTRSYESNPGERWDDQQEGFAKKMRWLFVRHKLYRDIWLLIITVLVFSAVKANSDRTDDIQQSRVIATSYSCQKFNEVVEAQNAQFVLIRAAIVSGAALPGDEIKPEGETDPLKWKSIKAGPLSKSIARQFPGFPQAAERFRQAKARAAAIEAKSVQPRNCKAEVLRTRDSG